MKLESAEISNFRILKDLKFDFEDDLSLIMGKNNTGKTSFLNIFQKFFESTPSFAFEDFSTDMQEGILKLDDPGIDNYEEISLSLKLVISYDDNDSLKEASELILDLNNDTNRLVILFEYILSHERYFELINDYEAYSRNNTGRNFEYYIRENMNKYFSTNIKALEYDNEDNYKLIDMKTVRNIISIQTVGARRDVENKYGKSRSLSALAEKYYNARVALDHNFPELEEQLSKTDNELSEIYDGIFDSVTKQITDMSYGPNEVELSISSDLQKKNLFQNNTMVKYKMNDSTLLPEDYNGLGYLNLFSMIFSIRIKIDELLRKGGKPTPINILFLEEPEAHTHPQMQYVFIKKIKSILKKDENNKDIDLSLQTVISTHSSHIISQCDFEDIRYFYRNTKTSVRSQNMKSLELNVQKSNTKPINDYERVYRFVKQYITLNRAELFFADKAILIEGDTERILMYAMMKKLDDENKENNEWIPLLSQNISVIETGAYSHIFSTFLGFLGIKSLIITDIDCAEKSEDSNIKKKCECSKGEFTTNQSINFFTGTDDLKKILSLSPEECTYKYDSDKYRWVQDNGGNLKLVFQREEKEYNARSFEDAFLCLNYDFVRSKEDSMISLKNRNILSDDSSDIYEIAEKCISGKTTFAMDLLLNDEDGENGWKVPRYIREGLEWLEKCEE